MSENLNDNYISIDEAAEYLGVKTVTLRNWIKKDEQIPAHKIGKLWKFKRSELDVWVKSGKSAMDKWPFILLTGGIYEQQLCIV